VTRAPRIWPSGTWENVSRDEFVEGDHFELGNEDWTWPPNPRPAVYVDPSIERLPNYRPLDEGLIVHYQVGTNDFKYRIEGGVAKLIQERRSWSSDGVHPSPVSRRYGSHKWTDPPRPFTAIYRGPQEAPLSLVAKAVKIALDGSVN
jgi:hypothetical protein